MYAFSLKPTGRLPAADTVPLPPPTHVIRAPVETAAPLSPPPPPPHAADSQHDTLARHRRDMARTQEDSDLSTSDTTPRDAPYSGGTTAATAAASSAVHVHNVSAYTDMRDAADWSAAVQRERTEKRQRALALHEAAKAEEQQRREAAELQSRKEAEYRREERKQLRVAAKEDEAMADFQERNSHFLRNQQRLMDLSASVRNAEEQRKARTRESMYQTWANTRAGDTGGGLMMMTNTAGWTPTGTSSHVFAPGFITTTTTTTAKTTSAVVPSKEAELRATALRTEDAYVQLSLAYRNEAQRSRAAAAILAGGGTATAANATRQRNVEDTRTSPPPPPPPAAAAAAAAARDGTPSVGAVSLGCSSTTTIPSMPAAVPFRTAPAMYSHDDAAHMGAYAHDIPTTYIPEYFGHGATAAAAAARTFTTTSTTRRSPPAVSAAMPPAEVMPLPLAPPPVSPAVSNALRDTYYPWAALADTGAASAPPVPHPREAYLPVERWGEADLQATVYGHGVNPDGTVQAPCERRREFQIERGYTTIPQDNATATSNAPDAVPRARPGKRLEVWL